MSIYIKMENQYYQDNMIDLNELPKIRSGAMWYVAILPVLALYLENYAINKWLGILVWAFALISCPVICYRDMRALEKLGLNCQNLKIISVVCPLLYMYKRCRLLKQSSIMAVFFTIFTVYAVLQNGFAVSLRVDDQTFINQVKYNYVANIDEFSDISADKSSNIIGEQIDAFINEDKAEYRVSADGDLRYITVSGSCDYDTVSGAELEIVFIIDYDCYAFKSLELDSVSLSGQALEGEKRQELLDVIFLNKKSSGSYGDSVSPKDSSSQYKTA
ncbi:hypothetical protein [Ruminococcus sp. Marseille-P6503]|uniref:hypothetical protein n=1 Tax=Ruminococcus sp. Marseille-P6503 TaxID=2364796 RepID=UPI000F53AD63|nr:hypothetical protein [Ruminococcus sp. Marseille-P6503]